MQKLSLLLLSLQLGIIILFLSAAKVSKFVWLSYIISIVNWILKDLLLNLWEIFSRLLANGLGEW